eukprot:567466-Rhodomonas_salina.2
MAEGARREAGNAPLRQLELLSQIPARAPQSQGKFRGSPEMGGLWKAGEHKLGSTRSWGAVEVGEEEKLGKRKVGGSGPYAVEDALLVLVKVGGGPRGAAQRARAAHLWA